MEKENQNELSKVLGLSRGLGNTNVASWAEIYVEIGRLKERALMGQREFTQTTGGATVGIQQGLQSIHS